MTRISSGFFFIMEGRLSPLYMKEAFLFQLYNLLGKGVLHLWGNTSVESV